MKKVELVSIAFFVLASLSMSSQVAASLMIDKYDSGTPTPENIEGYDIKDFVFIGGNEPTDRVDTPLGGSLGFFDRYDNPVSMDHSTANSEDWWVNGEVGDGAIGGDNDYDIYTTSLHLIKIMMPENLYIDFFSFNVGANMGAGAWLTVEESNGPGIPDKKYFGLSPDNTPGFGIYADNSNGCSHITSVTIDPHLIWGFGNFSISQGDCSSNVPEPSILALFAAGLFGVGFARRKMRN